MRRWVKGRCTSGQKEVYFESKEGALRVRFGSLHPPLHSETQIAERGGEGLAPTQREEDIAPTTELEEMARAGPEAVGGLEGTIRFTTWDMAVEQDAEEQFAPLGIGSGEVGEAGIAAGVEAHVVGGDVTQGTVEAIEGHALQGADEEHFADSQGGTVVMERQHPVDHLTERDPFDEEVMLEMGGEIDHVEARRKDLNAVVVDVEVEQTVGHRLLPLQKVVAAVGDLTVEIGAAEMQFPVQTEVLQGEVFGVEVVLTVRLGLAKALQVTVLHVERHEEVDVAHGAVQRVGVEVGEGQALEDDRVQAVRLELGERFAEPLAEEAVVAFDGLHTSRPTEEEFLVGLLLRGQGEDGIIDQTAHLVALCQFCHLAPCGIVGMSHGGNLLANSSVAVGTEGSMEKVEEEHGSLKGI